MSEPTRQEFTLPLWSVGFKEPADPIEAAGSLLRMEFPSHGRCAMFFTNIEMATKASSFNPRGNVIIEIGNAAALLLTLEFLKSAGDTEVGIDLVSGVDGKSSGRFCAISSMLNACRFWHHVEDDKG